MLFSSRFLFQRSLFNVFLILLKQNPADS